MAVLWGRRAARLGRGLWPCGRPGLPAEEGTLGGLCGPRRSSSASPREQDQDRRKDWGHVELLEVLQARVRQLQAESVSEVTVNRVDVARLPEHGSGDGGRQPPTKVQTGAEGGSPVHFVHWAKKLDKDKHMRETCRQRLEKQLQKQAQNLSFSSDLKRLHVEPQLLNKQLTTCLQGCVQEVPENPWEEQLAWVLQEAPRKLILDKKEGQGQQLNVRLTNRQQKILAFLKCCLLTGQESLAHHLVVTYHGKGKSQNLLTLDMYNTVMLGWARKGAFRELLYVFIMVKDAGFCPDLVSYAAALQCMGRQGPNAETIKRCLEQMSQEGLKLQEIFTTVPLCEEERAAVLKAVLKVKPTFKPPERPPCSVSTSKLLRDVYAKDGPVSYPKLHLPLETLWGLFKQQLRVELACSVHVKSVEKPVAESKEVRQARETLKVLRLQWEKALLEALRETKDRLEREAYKGLPSMFPFLCLLDEQEMVGMLLQTLQALPTQGESFMGLARDLGARTFARHEVQRQEFSGQVEALKRQYRQYLHLLASDTEVPEPCLPRQYWDALGVLEPPQEQPWPLPVQVELGSLLAEILVQAPKMPSDLTKPRGDSRLVPVLYHVYSFRNVYQIGFLKPHPAYVELLATAAEPTLTFEAVDVPMLCPPLPWTSPHTGAFLLSPTKLMRAVDGTMHHQRLLERCPPAALHGALDTLTQLGNCAWRVNGRVLDLVLELFQEEGCPKLGVPARPSEVAAPHEAALPSSTGLADKAELRRELARCLKEAREMHSLRTEALYRLSLAQHLRNRIFWLPHNMDFRGRTYPCPPHFNHLGNDLARALLEFAQGRPLGPHGLDWLKIHVVNLTGLKKREPLQARRAFAEEVMGDILDSADHPMTGRKWWMDSEEPWQTLACCMEIAKAVRTSDPAAYVSHLPVHQDGSCNGLQHYAALGRDSVGAASVNLEPAEVPQDVYSDVAAQVEFFRSLDARRGVRVAQVLEGFVTRKVVKQTVMTVVYGVTRYGGRLQIEKRLRELSDFPQEFLWEASQYLVRQVFRSLQEMFSGSRAIQHWLTESARLISHMGSAVEWVTPLGIPIIQPYHQAIKIKQGRSGLQSVSYSVNADSGLKPNKRKQRNGFPPNFIHSLDSTHMMLTALHCYREGLIFVSVHDCFWTHAADVPIMNQVCREQFVRLHSQPILQDLSSFLISRFCCSSRPQKLSQHLEDSKLRETLLAVPKPGSFDLERVKLSTFFFS
uniref:DNA-directed RNA polymerase n=1 Tax=Saimiri boliviensis boliviensis TaxID=39432 RepID=A0A2K6TCW0_SAIBB